MTDYPYLYYVNDYSGGVCVKECPSLPNFTDPYTLVTYNGLYQVDGATITSNDIDIADYSVNNDTLTCNEALCYPNSNPESSFTSYGVNRGKGFAYYALDTYEVMWRCVFTDDGTDVLDPIVNPNNDNFTEDVISSMTEQNEHIKEGYSLWNNLFGDLWISRYFILGLGFGAPLVVGFFYTFMMRIPGVLPVMVWLSVFATIGIFFAAAWYAGETASQWKAEDPPSHTADEIQVASIASYCLYAAGGLLVLLFLFMRKRIQLAMGCVKETSKAVMKMPLIILFPVLQGLGFMLFMIAWTVYAANLASMGDFDTKTFDAGNITISVRHVYLFLLPCMLCSFWYILLILIHSTRLLHTGPHI